MVMTMNKDKGEFPSQNMGREQYLTNLARSEIQDAIMVVVSGGASKPANEQEMNGFPDMTKCWKCGSSNLAMMKNRFQDKTMVWCLDCGKTWLERLLR